MRTALAAVMTGVNQPFTLREYPILPPPAGMAGLTLLASGVCGTDLHIHQGRLGVSLPAVIGHEFLGRVDAIAPEDSAASGIAPGDAVLVDIACPCGHCPLCEAGDDANCVHMGVTNGGDPDTPPHFHGGYAQYNVSPVANLVKLPAGLDPVMTAVFACAGPTVLHALGLAARAGISLAGVSTAVVQGLGPVGAFAAMALKAMGVPHVLAVVRRDDPRRAALAGALGADAVLASSVLGEAAILERIRALAPLGADLVLEASGNPQAIPFGLAALRNRGVYLIPGQYSQSGTVAIAPQEITFKALQLLGSSQYAMADVRGYLDFLQEHPALHGPIARLAACYPVSEVNRAVADAGAGRNMKTLLVP